MQNPYSFVSARRKSVIAIIFFFTSFVALAQYPKNLMFGFKAGAAYSGISNTSSMIVSETYYTGYSLNEESRLGATAGFFLNYKFEGTAMAIQPELMYQRGGGLLKYNDVNGLDYTIDFKYEIIRLTFLAKAYPVGGLHIGAGPTLGYNAAPSAITYKSNGEALYGPDLETQQQLRNVLKGRADFGICAGLGYEFTNGISIEACYVLGLSDVIETQANNFKFIDNTNKTSSIQFTVGYAIASDGKNFKRR